VINRDFVRRFRYWIWGNFRPAASKSTSAKGLDDDNSTGRPAIQRPIKKTTVELRCRKPRENERIVTFPGDATVASVLPVQAAPFSCSRVSERPQVVRPEECAILSQQVLSASLEGTETLWDEDARELAERWAMHWLAD